ncbi:DUF924 domain-containing protein [Pyxidicoccus parkwayensis]|uniref:DUF924 domain-containing protein n=1 Tax=Pyxidicoccus parkwayensis TaxID=2813578 RepID=A0ABX7NQM1_9BACT|nr:DUF924 family protein [Pyxidicoccus parkwaysis]QSQ20664.1 DUF924 domain-containing protein [Pyxidicoccus parkwaysis]
MASAEEVLGFWFGQPPDPIVNPASARQRDYWFARNEDFDEACRRRFLDAHEAAISGALDAWKEEPRSCLALVLLLDQFPRNLFRGTPQAFASDSRAREVARSALARGLDLSLPPVWRWFLYLPFEHSEEVHDQRLAVALFEMLALYHRDSREPLDYARRHREVIERFGRFPHRNVALGRPSTPEEERFLQEPGSAF